MTDEISVAGHNFAANQVTFACRHIMQGDSPALLYVREYDGDIQVLCGADNHPPTDCLLVCLSHVLNKHPDLTMLPIVEPGYQAWRDSIEAPWKIFKL